MTILKLTDRKADIRAAGPGPYVRSRIAEAADALSLKGTMAGRVELANESLSKLVVLVYEADTDGKASNVDLVSLRILIPLPWGSMGWRHWGLRAHEANVLRAIMLGRQATWQQGKPAPLFTYDPDCRYWTLNVHDYPHIDMAGAWLRASAISLAEWRKVASRYQMGAKRASSGRQQRV